METILASIITGVITLVGVFIANSKSQAIIETKVDALTREVREHNHFARRMPVMEEQIKGINQRMDALEDFCKSLGKGGSNSCKETIC